MKPDANVFRMLLAMIMMFIGVSAYAQVQYTAKNNINLAVSGTSTMHDWTMKSTVGNCNAVFILDESGKITGLNAMTFTTTVEGLKSGKSGMDKNAYEALKYKANPSITYKLTSATINANGTVSCRGVLTIAGHSVNTDLIATCKPGANGTVIAVSGTKKISMKDYNMEPPSFMMGTIKTGNDVVLDFSFNLTK